MTARSMLCVDGLGQLRGAWQRWQTHVNSDLDHFELVCGLRDEVQAPFVTVVERGGEIRALLAGRLERARIPLSLGYLTPLRLSARVIAVIHQGVVGELDDADAGEVVRHLWQQLALGQADAVDFHHLPEHSPLLRALQRDGHRWLCEKRPRWSTHREMLLPAEGSVRDAKLSAKHRYNLRRREKALARAFPGRLAWRWLSRFDDIPALCARLEPCARTTHQRRLGVGFFDNEEFRRRFELFARRGELRVCCLEIDGEVRAFWFGTVYKDVFHSSETGYDPALGEYEVGTLMFTRMVDELVRERVQRLDFGLGDAPYKQRFGDRSWRETSVWMCAPTAKGWQLMLALRLTAALDRTARRLVERAGLTDRLKAAWRRGRAPSLPSAAAGGRP